MWLNPDSNLFTITIEGIKLIVYRNGDRRRWRVMVDGQVVKGTFFDLTEAKLKAISGARDLLARIETELDRLEMATTDATSMPAEGTASEKGQS